MTQDEIIEMAREAGLRINVRGTYFFVGFGELSDLLDSAITKEREACAEVCDELHWPWRIGDNSGPKQCAIAIRARGEQT